MKSPQDILEAKYRAIVKVACLITLVLIIFIDAINPHFEASLEVELALIASVAGLEIKEKTKQLKQRRSKKK